MPTRSETIVQETPKSAAASRGRVMSGADVIIEVLAAEGVDTIFG
jgi:hypothetical protein